MSPPPSQPSVVMPEQFGPYRILRPLGKGGMGTVYLALDTRLNRQVALKVCHVSTHPTALERFRREFQAAAGFRHPNLCPVHEFDVRDGIAYLTMDYIAGQTLDCRLAERPLPQFEAALLVQKLALAMQAAHDKGVVHRDLKPANIAFDDKGEPVVLDFGLARQTDQAGTRLTQFGAIIGTPSYMAPEQIGGDPALVGPTCDVYALGVILYELLTGSVPFAGPKVAVFAQVLAVAPVPPRQRNPGVDASLEKICLTALAKKPADRYPSMTAFAAALATYVRSAPATNETTPRHNEPPPDSFAIRKQFANAVQPSPSELITLPRWFRRKPGGGRGWLGIAAGVLLLGLLVASGIVGLIKWRQHPPDSTVKDDRPGKPTHVHPKDKPSPLVVKSNLLEKPAVLFPSIVPAQFAGIIPLAPDRQAVAVLPKTAAPRDAKSLGMKFVRLPKGTFYMGWDGVKKGVKTEIKEDFEIAIHTVTQGQWQAVMGNNPSWFSRDGKDKDRVKGIADADLRHFPVENVFWEDAQEFIKKLNEKESGRGYLYRLPTEAEWEYACRGGATSEEECSHHFYFAKPTDNLSSDQANFNGTAPFGTAPKGRWLQRPTKVGSYEPNKLGVYDMHGNIWQWCSDPYGEGGSGWVIRGGSWVEVGQECRAAVRFNDAGRRIFNYGFRLARVPSDRKDDLLGMKFVPLPKGTFYMGWDGEKKGIKKDIKEDFEMAIHTVTQGQWHALMGNNPSWFSRDGEHKERVKGIPDADLRRFPVEGVSWEYAQEFIKKLNEKERGNGYLYRLPTEAEWEYACRGGATSEEECSFHFYFDKPTNNLSWEQANFNSILNRTTRVGSYKPNKLGLYDMHGNVWQWCDDLYEEKGSNRVIRGGSWINVGSESRAAYRFRYPSSQPNFSIGFRLARVPVR